VQYLLFPSSSSLGLELFGSITVSIIEESDIWPLPVPSAVNTYYILVVQYLNPEVEPHPPFMKDILLPPVHDDDGQCGE
jgi:hypothetical protein